MRKKGERRDEDIRELAKKCKLKDEIEHEDPLS